MAHMDGIELAERAREKYPDLKIVFLSAYSEVDYVRSALKVRAFDYILKPVDYDEIEQCFHKVVQQIEAEQLVQTAMRKMEDQISERLPTMKEHFLSALLKGQSPSGERLGSIFREFPLTIRLPRSVWFWFYSFMGITAF